MHALADVARAVLYEGYTLWPYSRASNAGRHRGTIGAVYPAPFSRAHGEVDPWQMQTECLVEANDCSTVDVHVRFLHTIERTVAQTATMGLGYAHAPHGGGDRRVAAHEATERQLLALRRRLDVLTTPERIRIAIPGGRAVTWLTDESGAHSRAVVRRWQPIDAVLELRAARVGERLFRLTARIINSTNWRGERRDEALWRTLVATHTILHVDNGAFVPLMGPPPSLRAAVDACENIGTRPVLAGVPGTRDTLLSSPISLYERSPRCGRTALHRDVHRLLPLRRARYLWHDIYKHQSLLPKRNVPSDPCPDRQTRPRRPRPRREGRRRGAP